MYKTFYDLVADVMLRQMNCYKYRSAHAAWSLDCLRVSYLSTAKKMSNNNEYLRIYKGHGKIQLRIKLQTFVGGLQISCQSMLFI
ncbi:hypothetical protein ACJX0J_028593 [Zea mays]